MHCLCTAEDKTVLVLFAQGTMRRVMTSHPDMNVGAGGIISCVQQELCLDLFTNFNIKSLALCPEAQARGLIDTSPSFLQKGDFIKSVRIDESVSLLNRKNKCSVILHQVHSALSFAHSLLFMAALNVNMFKTDANKINICI